LARNLLLTYNKICAYKIISERSTYENSENCLNVVPVLYVQNVNKEWTIFVWLISDGASLVQLQMSIGK
jgi:hypothetical protein